MAFITINESDKQLVNFAERMRSVPRLAVKTEYGTTVARLDERHARNIFKKVFPCATLDGILAGLDVLRHRLDV